MISLKDALFSTALILIGISPIMSESSEFGEQIQDNLPIEERFHIGKKSFLETQEFWRREKLVPYERAFKKHPNLDSCTNRFEERVELKWESFTDEQQAEVCLFHLAEYLETPQALSDWFEARGFRAGIWDIFGEWPSDKPPTVYASISLKNSNAPKLSGFRFFVAGDMGQSFSIGLGYNSQFSPMSSNLTIIWE